MANKKLDIKRKCVICHEKINRPKDKFVRLTDFDGRTITGECFYHLECWKNKFMIQQKKALEFVKPMLNDLLGKIDEVKQC